MKFVVDKYQKEWAVFCNTTRCHILFFRTKKEAEKECKNLNKISLKW